MTDLVMVQRPIIVSARDIDLFLATLRSNRTVAAYRRDLIQLQDFVAAESPVDGQGDLEAYRGWLAAAGYSHATIRRRLAVASQFLRWRDGVEIVAPRVDIQPGSVRLHGLDDMTALIGAVDGPDTVREGVAALLFASRVATVDGLLTLGPEHLGAGLRITIDDVEVRFPRSMRGTLELLLRSGGGGRLFGGLSRQTLTRRLRAFADGCGVEDCTPRSLRRSSGQITAEAVALLTGTPIDPARVLPGERLVLITDAVRERLQ